VSSNARIQLNDFRQKGMSVMSLWVVVVMLECLSCGREMACGGEMESVCGAI